MDNILSVMPLTKTYYAVNAAKGMKILVLVRVLRNCITRKHRVPRDYSTNNNKTRPFLLKHFLSFLLNRVLLKTSSDQNIDLN